MGAPKKYPDELRERAVRLYRQSDPKPTIRRLAEQLGVHHEALRNWIRQAEKTEQDSRPGPDGVSHADLAEENRRHAGTERRTAAGERDPPRGQRVFRLGARPDPATVKRFIEDHKDQFAVALLLRVLDVPASTFYDWRRQEADPCDRAEVDRGLLSNIYEIWDASGRTYGADRVHRQLRREGIFVGRKRVERLMAGQGWHGAYLRRGWKTGQSSTRQNPAATPAPDLVNRDFTATAPNQLWVADATRIPCGQGVFWLAAVRDVYSRRIVGWKTSDRCDTDLILGAFEYAIWTRQGTKGLIHHSDRSSNYTSFRFGQALADLGMTASMGSVGDSYDNALMENFSSTLKTELVYRTAWRTRDEAENALFAYIDGWYNTRRIQRRLDYLSPDEYETLYPDGHPPHLAVSKPLEPTGAR